MDRSTRALAERAGELSRTVDSMAWGASDAELEELLRGAKDGTLIRLVEQVGTVQRLLDAVAARVAGEVARRSSREQSEPLAKRMGERSAAALIGRTAQVGQGRASDWCRLGQRIAGRTALTGDPLPSRRPNVARSVDAGPLPIDSARHVLDALDTVEAHLDDRILELERFLVEQAVTLPATDLAALCRAIPDRIAPDGAEHRERELRDKAGMQVIQRRDGLLRWVIDAHPEAAGYLTAALDARTAPRRAVRFVDVGTDETGDGDLADRRTLAQKRLDALVDIARDSLRADDGDLAGQAVTMLVTVPLETLTTGIGSATIFGVAEPIAASTARRLACEARIIPVVLGGDSQPLELGAARRFFTPAQRAAMAVRDRGCVWPGCTAPPSHCDAAHLVPWKDGGPTDIRNGLLLCSFHHRRFDNDGWSITVDTDGRWLIPPPWVDSARTPRALAPPARHAA